MYTKQSKKVLPLNVLDILQRYTDENHRLSQRDIEKLLADKYDMIVDRRSIKRSIMDLVDVGFDIEFSETPRMVRDKKTGLEEEQYILSEFYLIRDFTNCEIRLLIDELLDSKIIPSRQRKQLISKLEGLSSIYFRKRYPTKESKYGVIDNQLFYSMEIVEEALANDSKVSFFYQDYQIGLDGNIQPNKEEYLVTPLEMYMTNGEYILSCFDETASLELRMDYISDISIVESRESVDVFTFKEKVSCECSVLFLVTENMLSDVVMKFGIDNTRVFDDGDELKLRVYTDEDTAVSYALDNLNNVTIVSPETCRNRVIKEIKGGMERYC